MSISNMIYVLICIFFIWGCADSPLNQVITETAKPSGKYLDDISECYLHLDWSDRFYALVFDKECVDTLLTTGEIVKTPVVRTTVIKIVNDPEPYETKTVQVDGIVLNKNDETLVAQIFDPLDMNQLLTIVSAKEVNYFGKFEVAKMYRFTLVMTVAINQPPIGVIAEEPIEIEN